MRDDDDRQMFVFTPDPVERERRRLMLWCIIIGVCILVFIILAGCARDSAPSAGWVAAPVGKVLRQQEEPHD